MKSFNLFFKMLGFASLFALAACGSSSGDGTMSVGLTDGPTEAYSAVYVTITEVQVN